MKKHETQKSMGIKCEGSCESLDLNQGELTFSY